MLLRSSSLLVAIAVAGVLPAAPAAAGGSPGSLQFSSATYETPEGDGGIFITLTRTGGSDGVVDVYIASSDGTAVANEDYTDLPDGFFLRWEPGDTADKRFVLRVTNDAVAEPDETVNLSLSNPTNGAVIGEPSTAVVNIRNDDGPVSQQTLQF